MSNIDTFGLDETSVAKGHDYITLFVDLYKKEVVHISDGKDHKTVSDFVQTLEQHNGHKEQKSSPLVAICPLPLLKGLEKICRMPKLRLTSSTL